MHTPQYIIQNSVSCRLRVKLRISEGAQSRSIKILRNLIERMCTNGTQPTETPPRLKSDILMCVCVCADFGSDFWPKIRCNSKKNDMTHRKNIKKCFIEYYSLALSRGCYVQKRWFYFSATGFFGTKSRRCENVWNFIKKYENLQKRLKNDQLHASDIFQIADLSIFWVKNASFNV